MSARKDQESNLLIAPSILPVAATADVNGAEVDIQGFESATLVLTATTASVGGTIKIQESDVSGSGYTDVADTQIVGGSNDIAIVEDKAVKLGYAGNSRYLRAVFTHSADGVISGDFILGTPHLAPTAATT